MTRANGYRHETVVDIKKPVSFTGGLQFECLTYTVTKKNKVDGKRSNEEDDRLFPMLTVYETLMFAADFRLGPLSLADKKQRVEKLIEQLGLSSSRNTYIGDEGTRGVSGGERRRVSIGVDIIHGPSLLFLDEPTSGLDSTSAHSVIEKVHDIARSGSTVILTIHQPSSRIQFLLDHLIILARGQLMFQGSPKDVVLHLGRMSRKVLHHRWSNHSHAISCTASYSLCSNCLVCSAASRPFSVLVAYSICFSSVNQFICCVCELSGSKLHLGLCCCDCLHCPFLLVLWILLEQPRHSLLLALDEQNFNNMRGS